MNLKSYSKTYFVLFILLLFSVWSCATHQKKEGFNKTNGKYYNSEIGFEIDIPKNWYVLSEEQIENMLTKMNNKMLEDKIISKEEVDSSKMYNNYRFQGFKYRPNIDVEKHPDITIVINNVEKIPNIQIVVNNIENSPNIKTEMDYIACVEFGRDAPIKLNPSNVSKKVFSNRNFYFLNFSKGEDKKTSIRRSYTTLVGKFALSVTVSYFNEEQKKEIEEILETMKFEK